MKVYGIRNCNTVTAAITWLRKKKIGFDFHDYKKSGISDTELDRWIKQVGWESLVNRRGTTWRQLSEREKQAVVNARAAKALMKRKPTVIKRPLIEEKDKVLALGFDEPTYNSTF